MDRVEREYWKPSNMLYPVPAVLISCQDEEGNANIMTAAWAGTVCSDPVMVSVSIRPERYSHDIIERTGEFVICLTTRDLVFAADYAGVRSGRNEDKFSALGLTKLPSKHVRAPGIAQSPVCLECKVENILRLGSHDMFIGRVLSTDIDPAYLDEKGASAWRRRILPPGPTGLTIPWERCWGPSGFPSERNRGRIKRERTPKEQGETNEQIISGVLFGNQRRYDSRRAARSGRRQGETGEGPRHGPRRRIPRGDLDGTEISRKRLRLRCHPGRGQS